MMRFLLAGLAALLVASAAAAQTGTAWVQIEARPTEAAARERARAWEADLGPVAGFRLASGWYAIALGPYTEDDAALERERLRSRGIIPFDAFVADGRAFRGRFWPEDGADTAAVRDPGPAAEPRTDPAGETLSQARAGERLLSRSERADLQRALAFAGAYDGPIDADFGPGTRRAMAAWQRREGFAETGVLTSAQRNELLANRREALAALGLTEVIDEPAGIAIELPTALVDFARHEPPFSVYGTEGGVQVLLISQPGGRARLAALYEVLQTLDIVPMEGPRRLSRTSFDIAGTGPEGTATAFARTDGETVKGWLLAWPADERETLRRAAAGALSQSFRTISGVLPDAPAAGPSTDLLAGLGIRRPGRTLSGFFVDRGGRILTAADPLGACERITFGEDIEAVVTASRDGLALLEPAARQVPVAWARFPESAPPLNSEVAVAGFPYENALPLPVLTFGELADLRGLSGEDGMARLTIRALPGDTGGPVMTEAGGVFGLLLPPPAEGERQLPGDVRFAAPAGRIAAFLEAAGVPASAAGNAERLPPEDLVVLAADMTVAVNCWN